MLNSVIKFALNQRMLVIFAALFLIVYGIRSARKLSIDVLPDITRPRVAIITECPGLSPEEVESRVTFPLESSLNGAEGVETIRSSSDIGLSVVQVEFGWNQDIYVARQIVQERLASVQSEMAPYEPLLAPNSTLLGQIMMVGLWSENGKTDPIKLRELADWTLRRRLMQVPGVAQVITMGGGKKQFQILVNPHSLHQFETTLAEVEQAVEKSNLNVSGGYQENEAKEVLVRGIGRIRDKSEIEDIVVKRQPNRSVLIKNVARVIIGEQIKRGDSSVNGREAVVMTIQKQPSADTRLLTEKINQALEQLQSSLPPDVKMQTTYEQREFIDYSVGNVIDAIRDGTILVVIILFLFLLNFRTTAITLTAIPLSLITTFVVFKFFGFTINVMTLGGIAVALGELVDDAIVDVENIFKRLKQNAAKESPNSVLQVIFEASSEVRGAIVISTIIVILAFTPLFALSGIEGRLFAPLGIAYMVAILASTAVSLTVTPVLSFYLLPQSWSVRKSRDGLVLVLFKKMFEPLVRFSMTKVGFGAALMVTIFCVVLAGVQALRMGKDFLPPFDEGASQANLFLQPGASLENSRRISQLAHLRLQKLLKTPENPEGLIVWYTAKSGRAENDEHVMGVNVTEITLSLNPDHKKSQDEMVKLLQDELKDIPGAEIEIEQPIAHLISHMLSGVAAEIGVKIYGNDLVKLQMLANQVKAKLSEIEGLTDPIAEQQQMVEQLQIRRDTQQLGRYGIQVADVHRMVETAMQGTVATEVLANQKVFDVLVRFDNEYREDLGFVRRMPIELPEGTRFPLSEVAEIKRGYGPIKIQRDNSQRRIVVRVNTLNRDLGSAVREIQEKLAEIEMPEGYYTEIGGQYQAQQSALRTITLLGALALVGIFVVLFVNFGNLSHVLQTLIAIPVGFVGGVGALTLTGQTLSIAAAVGFISLAGISIRNGILLIESYRQYHDRENIKRTIVQGSMSRLAPVLMTTLTTGFGLLPLVIGGTLPGKEILFPVATVILGGLITSAVAEYILRPGLYYFLGHYASDSKQNESLGSVS